MCLTYVTTPKKLKSEGTGYKIFYKTQKGNLKFNYLRRDEIIPTEKWINEKNHRLLIYKKKETINSVIGGISYPMGFHVYRNKNLAKKRLFYQYRAVLVPVKFRKACASGKQSGTNVIVAKEIFIPK